MKKFELHPEEMSHRTGRLAVDLAYMMARYVDSFSIYLSKQEMFHLQMSAIYILVDIMGATHGSNSDAVLDQCKIYFRSLERSEHFNAKNE